MGPQNNELVHDDTKTYLIVGTEKEMGLCLIFEKYIFQKFIW